MSEEGDRGDEGTAVVVDDLLFQKVTKTPSELAPLFITTFTPSKFL